MTSRHVLFTCRRWLAVGFVPFALSSCDIPSDPVQTNVADTRRASLPTTAPAPTTPSQLVDALASAYDARDPARFAALLDRDFLFILAPIVGGPDSWDVIEEKRIHRRMFRPAEIPPSEAPLPPDLWVAALDAKLTQQTPFEELADYYQSPTNPGGIDPKRAKVWGAEYATSVLWQLQGDTDYLVGGRAWFVVVTQLAPPLGSAPQATLLRWQDLGSDVAVGPGLASEEASWSALKKLYR
jgi:hypothetical protein